MKTIIIRLCYHLGAGGGGIILLLGPGGGGVNFGRDIAIGFVYGIASYLVSSACSSSFLSSKTAGGLNSGSGILVSGIYFYLI